MANVDQKNLIPLCILEVLKKYSDPEHLLTHNMIADHLEKDYNISPPPERKSISRNLENLRDQLELDIEITPKGSYLVSHDFEDYEIRLLIDSVLSNKFISRIETAELVDKLKRLSGEYFESYEENLLTIDNKKKTDKRDLYLKLQMVNEAINSGKDLHFVLDKEADYPGWMLTRLEFEEMITGVEPDIDAEVDRSAQIRPEYLVLLDHRYYVAFKAILYEFGTLDYHEALDYCSIDDMTELSIVDHMPVRLPEGVRLIRAADMSEDAVREMVSRGVLEHPETKKLRIDILVPPRLLRKTLDVLGEPVLTKEYPGMFPHVRVIVDANRDTFERFWWHHLTEIKVLGPQFEITWLKKCLSMAKESIDDAEIMRRIIEFNR